IQTTRNPTLSKTPSRDRTMYENGRRPGQVSITGPSEHCKGETIVKSDEFAPQSKCLDCCSNSVSLTGTQGFDRFYGQLRDPIDNHIGSRQRLAAVGLCDRDRPQPGRS